MRLGFGYALIAAAAIATTAFILSFTAAANAQTRVALVIGNGAYRNVPELPNPPNDTADVAAAFGRLGFSVRLVTNASYDDMRRALLEFSRKARGSEMAVVFFAGHGMEVAGENWLIPIDAELRTDLDSEQEAISLRSVMLMVSSASKLGLIMLDACRNNPFLTKMKRTIASSRSATRGLTRIEPANNVLVAYAAKDGTTASDGNGRNSPFTTALLKYVETPGLEINFLFRHVRDEVIAATGHEQEPFVYGSLSGEAIYFIPPAALASAGNDQIAWSMLRDTTDENGLKRFIAQYPTSEMRKDAEARVAALAAQRTKSVLTLDEIAWSALRESNDVDLLRRFVEQFPNSTQRAKAERRLAMLAAPPSKPSSANPADARELARSLQFELKRVGCFNESVNGEYDDVTRTAWRRFAKLAAITMPEELSPDSITAIRGINKRVCPLACPDGSHAHGELCVANAAPPPPPPKRARAQVYRDPPVQRAAPPEPSDICNIGGMHAC